MEVAIEGLDSDVSILKKVKHDEVLFRFIKF